MFNFQGRLIQLTLIREHVANTCTLSCSVACAREGPSQEARVIEGQQAQVGVSQVVRSTVECAASSKGVWSGKWQASLETSICTDCAGRATNLSGAGNALPVCGVQRNNSIKVGKQDQYLLAVDSINSRGTLQRSTSAAGYWHASLVSQAGLQCAAANFRTDAVLDAHHHRYRLRPG